MSDVVIYEDGTVALSATVENETVWLSQKQMAELFGKSVKTINEHVNNVFKEDELQRDSVIRNFRITANDGKKYNTNFYNLDVIISIGYRVKSKQGTQFRIWANKILKEYLINGYVLNQEKLQQKKLDELDQTIQLIKQGLKNQELSTTEAKGFVEIIGNYAKSWALLQGYDEQSLQEVVAHTEQKFILDYDEALEAIAELKRVLVNKGEATQLFGRRKQGSSKATCSTSIKVLGEKNFYRP